MPRDPIVIPSAPPSTLPYSVGIRSGDHVFFPAKLGSIRPLASWSRAVSRRRLSRSSRAGARAGGRRAKPSRCGQVQRLPNRHQQFSGDERGLCTSVRSATPPHDRGGGRAARRGAHSDRAGRAPAGVMPAILRKRRRTRATTRPSSFVFVFRLSSEERYDNRKPV